METQRLYRSKSDRMISGVCGGLGKYFNVDSTLIRLIFLLLAVFGGGGVILYIILAIIMPEEGSTAASTQDTMQTNAQDFANRARELGQSLGQGFSSSSTGSTTPTTNRQGPMIIGGVLIALGILFLAQNFLRFDFWRFWPLILVLIGLAMLVPQFRRPQS
jgi:phage shock protein C